MKILVAGPYHCGTNDDPLLKKANFRKFEAAALSTAGFVDGDGASAKFHDVGGLGIDAQDHLYVADIVNNCIRKISFK